MSPKKKRHPRLGSKGRAGSKGSRRNRSSPRAALANKRGGERATTSGVSSEQASENASGILAGASDNNNARFGGHNNAPGSSGSNHAAVGAWSFVRSFVRSFGRSGIAVGGCGPLGPPCAPTTGPPPAP